jgi:hypothetical protein
MCLAAQALGWEAREVASSTEVRSLDPDFVIALHFFTPKLTGHPTYGCMWNPPEFVESEPRYVKSALSYDGYLSSSPQMTDWVRKRLSGAPKKFFVVPFYASCNSTTYRSPDLETPRLFYAGTNWDGPRFRELFSLLDSEPYLDVYGPRDRWPYLRASYRGILPFDGTSVPEALHRTGVGLCLHRDEHRAAGTPSIRIFEIAASGAVAICQEHPFIREAFGNSVLYLDPALDTPGLAAQVTEHMRWIGSHQDEAIAMSRKAHAVFQDRFTLELLLQAVAGEHEKLVAAKAFVAPPAKARPASPRVQYIVRAGARSPRTLPRALASLAAQTAPGVGAIIVRHEEVELGEVLGPYRGKLPLEIVEGQRGGVRSTHLWAGLEVVSGEYFGVLDDDDALHPNHAACLLSILDGNEEARVAYSGAIRVWEPGFSGDAQTPAPPEPAELLYAEPFDRDELFAVRNYITSNSFLASSELLRELPKDPQLPLLEDLFLLLALSLQTPFVYSYEATSEFFWRADRSDNTMLGPRSDWNAAADRVAQLVWTGGLLTEHAGPAIVSSHQMALRSSGLKTFLESRRQELRECAQRDKVIANMQRECAERDQSIAYLQRECALRDQVIANMERSKGWRLVLAFRQARDRLRGVSARITSSKWT